MHQHIIAAAQTAATTAAITPGERHVLAIGAAVLVFVVGVGTSWKRKPRTS